MADELLDQVDKNDEIIGTVWKSNAHKNIDIIHREVACVVFDNNGEVLLQQRSFNKKNDPGVWKITAAGHPESKESPSLAIERELKEELGIVAKHIFFKKYFSVHDKDGENKESRFIWVYYAILDNHPQLNLQTSEVNDAKWVKINDLKEFAKNNNYDMKGSSQKLITEIYITL